MRVFVIDVFLGQNSSDLKTVCWLADEEEEEAEAIKKFCHTHIKSSNKG